MSDIASPSSSTRHDLNGKNAVVTGSSSGIGHAIALELSKAGANVLIHARSNQPAAEATAAMIRASGHESTVVVIDLADLAGQDELVQRAWNWREGIDVWVNNAGADVLTGERSRWSFDRKLDLLWRVDVVGTIRLARQIGQLMQQRKPPSGVILNMGWDQAECGMAGESGELFAASKGAIMAFTRSLAKSVAPHVRVNCVAPGWIRTAWGEHAADYWQERARSESLRGRWGTPEDVARTAAFLVSPAADFITGQVIAINGGMRMSHE